MRRLSGTSRGLERSEGRGMTVPFQTSTTALGYTHTCTRTEKDNQTVTHKEGMMERYALQV